MATAQINLWQGANLDKFWDMIKRKEEYALRTAKKYGNEKPKRTYRLYRTNRADVFAWDDRNCITKFSDLIDLMLIEARECDCEGSFTVVTETTSSFVEVQRHSSEKET